MSGLKGGRSAGEHAETTGAGKVDYGELEELKERMLAPLGRQSDLEVNDVIYQIHEAVVPVKYNLHRENGRLEEALDKIERAKGNLARVGARDYHELSRYHQADSMALSAEWTLKSALMREESRGTHHRDDYPNRDDKNWLKWILIKDVEGPQPSFFTETVPLQRDKLKP